MKNLILFTVLFSLLMTGNIFAQNITYNSPWHSINSPHGSIKIGAANIHGAHIYTDMNKFFFNKPVWAITGEFSAYNNKNLKLQTGGTTRMTILESNGNVGVGTDIPSHKLTVEGTTHTLASFIQKKPNSKDGRIRLQGSRSDCPTCSVAAIEMYNFDSNEGASGTTYPLATVSAGMETPTNKTGYLRFFTNEGVIDSNGDGTPEEEGNKVKERMRITSNGNVGIGTTTPSNKLEVNGTIRAREIIVEEDNWPDYVFYDDYNLPTLEEEEKHIEANGHLLGFESEEDMAGDIQLGDVTKRQQVKIEEVVLHLIEMKKEIKQLKKENKQLKAQIVEK